jgi:hypothetical protein
MGYKKLTKQEKQYKRAGQDGQPNQSGAFMIAKFGVQSNDSDARPQSIMKTP